ncbi:MAG: MFS transporter [Rhodospirillales bacterium]|nr:MFS transporter [Rhodospirillales bacterium]
MRFDPRAAGVALAGMVNFLNLYSVQAVMPTLARDFDVSVAQAGLTVTASTAAVALVAPAVGMISDALGRKRLIVGAMWALVIPTLLAGFAPSLSWLLLWRFVQGLMLPFIFAVTVAYVGDETEGGETIRLAGTYSAGTIFGGFAGRFIAGIAASLAGWRASFFVLAVLTVAGALAVAWLLPRERRFRPVRGVRAGLGGFAEHLRNPRLIATYAVGFAVLFSIVAAFTYANFLLAAPPYGLGPAELGAIFVVYLVGMVVTPLATRLAVRWGRRATLALAYATGIAGLALSLLPSLAAIIAGLAGISAAVFIEGALSIGFIGAAARRAKSVAVGLYVTVYYIGGSLGGIVPASVWHRFGWPGCVALIVLVQSAMLAIAWRWWREV